MKYKTLMRIKKSSYLCLQKPEQSYKLFKLFLEVKEKLPEKNFQNQEEHRSKELTWNHKTSNMNKSDSLSLVQELSTILTYLSQLGLGLHQLPTVVVEFQLQMSPEATGRLSNNTC
jgi:hypothetical protein